jgi:anaerobic magnesium-protoporphyrin IX monomethyl ester cyclase
MRKAPRVAIVYPPLKKGKQYAQLSQNRQFRYMYSNETKIYPMVMASAATWISECHEVLWLDAINERLSDKEFSHQLWDFRPDVIIFETKTPVIKRHWSVIDDIKKRHPDITCVLVGDHISLFPEESLQNCKADYCVTGGDYDHTLKQLVDYLGGSAHKVPPGCYHRNKGRIVNSGKAVMMKDIDIVPFIDRKLTRWDLYGEAYLYRPCTYILTGRGCGGTGKKPGVCTFCVWQHAFWRCTARLRSPANVVKEIKHLVDEHGVREIFDDNESGAVWNRKWLRQFHKEMTEAGLIGRVTLSTNARADSLDDETCRFMKRIGYRLLKVGLESGNEKTLEAIRKLESLGKIKEGIKTAKRHGLIIMLTTMVGYPWETEEDAARTYEAAKELMLYKTHFGDVLQSSIVVPYPGTPLHEEAKRKGWLVKASESYENYDMSHRVLDTKIDTDKWCKKMWQVHYEPLFILKSLLSIRRFSDVKFALTGLRSLTGHVRDYES